MLATGLLQISQAEVLAYREELMEQVTHPIHEYTPERVARLLEQCQMARRFTFSPFTPHL